MAGVGTPGPITIAALMRGGPQGLAPWNTATMSISAIMKTTPAIRPETVAAFEIEGNGVDPGQRR